MTTPNKKFKPRQHYAICDAKIATILNGRRVVLPYRSGQKLKGRLADRKDGML